MAELVGDLGTGKAHARGIDAGPIASAAGLGAGAVRTEKFQDLRRVLERRRRATPRRQRGQEVAEGLDAQAGPARRRERRVERLDAERHARPPSRSERAPAASIHPWSV